MKIIAVQGDEEDDYAIACLSKGEEGEWDKGGEMKKKAKKKTNWSQWWSNLEILLNFELIVMVVMVVIGWN